MKNSVIKNRVGIIVLALLTTVSLSACHSAIVDKDIYNSKSAFQTESSASDEEKRGGNTDPDKANSLREYIELYYGPITDDYDEMESDGMVSVIVEDKEYGFMYFVKKAKDAPYSECESNFATMYKGYIHDAEEENIESLVDGINDKVELNFLESDFILGEFSLSDTSKAPELTEKLSAIFEKYDDRHFYDGYLITAKDQNGDLIGSYTIGKGYVPET